MVILPPFCHGYIILAFNHHMQILSCRIMMNTPKMYIKSFILFAKSIREYVSKKRKSLNIS